MNDYKVNIEINTEVSEIFAKTIVTQKFKNPTSNPLELKIYVYKIENIIFSSFSAQIGDSIKVKSKVIKKEKAKEKYNDAISSGNAAITVNEDEYINRLVIDMGNIPPNEEVTFISEFIQLTETSKTYEFELFRNLPIFNGDTSIFQNENLKGTVEIKTKNKIVKLEKNILMKNLEIIEEKNKDEEQIYNYLIQYQILNLPKFDGYNTDYIPSSKIYFYTDENKDNYPFIYCQKSDLNKNEKSYIISYKYNKKTDNLEISPALFIFLIDQSGSMSGNPINIVSKALELFLQSLPVGSYYQLIGFGSTFEKYDEIPKSYTIENIEKSLQIINGLKANLGGTDIYKPLKSVYDNNNIYDKTNLPKNIFLLTDGEIENKSQTLALIEKNSSEYCVYSIGIGKSFDKELIKNSGILGKGGYNFCPNLESLNSIIINEINKCVNFYISKFNMKSSLDKNCLYKTYNASKIVKNNQVVNIGYIIKDDNNKDDNKIKIDMEYFEDSSNKKINFEIIPDVLKDGNELSKLIINNYMMKNINKKQKEELALKYQLLTENTSLFAEIELLDKISDEMKTKVFKEPNYYNKKEIIKNEIKKENKNENKNENNYNDEFMLKLNRIPYYNYKRNDKKSEKKNKISNIFSSIFNVFKKKKKLTEKADFVTAKNIDLNSIKLINNDDEEFVIDDYLNYNYESKESSNNKINTNIININNNDKLDKDELMKMIKTQDFIERFWHFNGYTLFLKKKYEKEYEILKNDKIINDNAKIILTILIIY